ncbi:MAG: hypothetical protein ACAI43_13625 [Phycisphaerae bacterium]
MNYRVERDDTASDGPGAGYAYRIYDGDRLVARYWHDTRGGGEPEIEFADGLVNAWGVPTVVEFLEGGGGELLRLTDRAVGYLSALLDPPAHRVPDVRAALLAYLRQHCAGPGEAHGMSPLRLRQELGRNDLVVATAVYLLERAGLVGYDGKATMPFSDPIALSGYHLTNVYLTAKGWASRG